MDDGYSLHQQTPDHATPATTLYSHADPRCGPVRHLMQRIGSRWPVLIIAHLDSGPRRFSELKRDIGRITQKSLTTALRELEQDGLIERTVTPIIPPRVDYALTPLGRTLLTPLKALVYWAIENEDSVAEARARYQEKQSDKTS